MKSLKFGVASLLTATMLAAPVLAQSRFDYRESLPYRGDYQQEVRGSVHWSKGDTLPSRYRGGEFVVRDLRGNNLRPPPRGFMWVRVNNQFLLASNRTGSIRDVIRIEDRSPRDWGNARPTPEFPDRGPPPRINDPRDQEARWRDRYARTYTVSDDSYYRECQNRPDAAGVAIGAVLGGLLGNALGNRNNSGLTTVAGVIAGGAIAAGITSKMNCDDKAYAYRTYTDGFNSGRTGVRYDWNNPQSNNRGEFTVNDYYDDPDGFRCAEYTQRVTINGRPENANGRACRQPDGAWAMIN